MELGWIDFSKTERNNVLNVLELLGKKGILDVLVGIAKNDINPHSRKCAVEKISSQNVLKDIAKNDIDNEVRQAAAIRIKDGDVLADIAKTENSSSVLRAIAFSTDNENILRIIKERDILSTCPYCGSLKIDYFERDGNDFDIIYGTECSDCGREFDTSRKWK